MSRANGAGKRAADAESDLPEGWAAAQIRDLFEVKYGKALKAEVRQDGDVAVFGSNGVVGSHDVPLGNGPVVLIGRKGSVGAVHFHEGTFWAIDTTYFLDDFRGLDPRYVACALRFSDLSQLESSSAIPGLSRELIYDESMLIPPAAEQNRIVARVEELLARVNGARERLARVPLVLKRFREAILAAACDGRLTEDWRMQHPGLALPAPKPPSLPKGAPRGRRGANLSTAGELFLDEVMPEIPVSWSYLRADSVVEPGTVITYGIVLPGPEVPWGVPYVRQQDIDDGVVHLDGIRHTSREIAGKHDRSSLRRGDVLLCIIRNLRVAVVPKELDGANITQGTVRLRPSSLILGPYLLAFLSSRYAQGWMKRRYFGMDMPRINVEDARAIPVALPPVQEQREIVRRVEALLKLVGAVENRVAAATARAERTTQAILSKAFRGGLVPTEAELARREGRGYESATVLLERIRGERADLLTKGGRGRLVSPRGAVARAKHR